MTASFIKKQNGNYYLRLTGDTESVRFAAVSEASNTYTFYVNGDARVYKPYDDSGAVYYSTSANPIPSGGNLNDGRFPGAESVVSYPGSGIRDYALSFSAGPVGGTFFALGGEALSWGGYAYPGDGYISNSLSVGIKQDGNWKNAGNIFVKQFGSWKEVITGWIKVDGIWKKFYQNFGNSSWINMVENTDDAIDFAVQVIALWTWPVLPSSGQSGYYPESVTSSATSSTVYAPVSQSITLTIELRAYGGSSAYSSILLRRISDSAIIWSYALSGSSGESISYTTEFYATVGESYRFESTVTVPENILTTNYARVIRENGTLGYSNIASTYVD